MKKIFLILLSFSFYLCGFAQSADIARTSELVTKNSKEIGLSEKQLDNYFVSSAYTQDQFMYSYLNQSYKGLPVHNQMIVLSSKGGAILSKSGVFLENIESFATATSSVPTLSAKDAVLKAFASEKVSATGLGLNKVTDVNKFNFGTLATVTEEITGELIWAPIEKNGKLTSVNLVWNVMVAPKGTDDMWKIMVDANTGAILAKHNNTISDNWGIKAARNPDAITARLENLAATEKSLQVNNNPTAIANASYLVVPYPAESPQHPGGTPILKTNPWLAAPGNATTLGWHSDGTTDYTISRGNNVWATEDQIASSQNTGPAAVSSTNPDLTFNFPPNFVTDPRNAAFQQFAITNLFYWNNIIHDITYTYGFTEPAGNFQKNNQGRGGAGGDDVIALAQSGGANAAAPVSIGNNANFSTPVDGSRGRMRMYLFDAPTTTIVHTNAPTVNDYNATESGFSTANLLTALGPVTGPVALFQDQVGAAAEACTGPPSNSLSGKIAIINRGNCAFVVKALEAQAAGAIGIIMINNVATPATLIMGGTDNTITIPAVMVSQANGAALIALVNSGLNVTLSTTAGVPKDGDLDNGIVVHEFGHGVSTRLTGGPANSSCLNNNEEAGEGWSDYLGLMLTTNWATATLADGPLARAVGNYALSQPAVTGPGIRYKPYSTSLTVNPLTYTNMATPFPYTGATQGEVHDIGEIWCATVWDMTWAIIGQENSINPNLYNYDAVTTTGGNSISLKLVLEGMKLQPCGPGYIDARNGILAADRNLYAGRHACPIWTAFAKRGMGFGASQGSANVTTDQVPTTVLPPAPTVTLQPVDVSAAAASNAAFQCSAGTDINTIYRWEVSTNGGTTWAPVSPAVITPTLTLTAVTSSMNGYKYRCVAFIGCATTTSSVATLTVTGGVTPPVFTTSPGSTSACAGTNVTFTGAASNATSYNWQVSTNGGTTWVDVTPANTTTTLTLTAVTTALNNNQYRMTATGSSSVNSTPATLTVNAAPAAPTVSGAATYCQGSTASPLTATGAGLLWYTTATGGAGSGTAPTISTATAGATNYYVSQTVSGCESPRASIVITITATPTAPTATTAVAYCQGATATQLTATGAGLLWYAASAGGVGSATAPTPTTAAVGTINYYVSQTVTGCESPRTAIAVTITATPAAPGITTPVSYCQGVTASPLTATGTGLLWYAASAGGVGSATAPTPSTATVGGTSYYASQTTGCESPRVAIVVNVVAGTAAPTVVSPLAYCQGATALQLTATGTGLLWYTTATNGTGSATAPTPSTAAAGSLTYYVSQTSGACESPRAAIVVTTTATPVAPTVTSPISYCQAATATALTATGTNLKWYTVPTAGVASTTAPIPSTAVLGSTTYYVSQSTGVCEGPRAAITVTITAVPAAPTVTTPVAYCQGATASTLTATGTGLLWYAAAVGGTGSATATIPSTAIVGTTMYYVSQTTGCEGPRAAITVTINATPAAPTVTSAVAYCQGAATTQLTAIGTGLLWYTVPTNGAGSATAPIPSSATAGSTSYYVSQTTSGCESPRATITITVTALPTAPTVSTPVTYCQNATAAILTATGTNLKWYTVPTAGAALASAPTPVTTTIGSTIYYVSQSTGTCEGPRAAIVVNVTAVTAAPTVTSPVTYCQNATAIPLTAGGTGLLWYNTATNGTGSATAPTPSTTTVGSTTYYVSQTGTCESARTPIVVNVTTTAAAPVAASPINYCQGNTASPLTASGVGLLWYTTATNGTGSATAPTPSTTTAGTVTYYVSQTTGSCESPRTAVVVNVGSAPAITVQPVDITSCTTTATFTATASGTNLTYQWQVSTDGGLNYTNIPTATSNTLVVTGLTTAQANNKYRLVVSSASCPTATSVAVTARVGTPPVVVLTAAPTVNFNPSINGGLFTTVSPPGTYTYAWKRNNATIANTSTSITKANGLLDDFGTYVVTVTDAVTGCFGVSNSIAVSDIESERDRLFVGPNPTNGIINVSYYSASTASQSRMISVYDAKGARLMFKQFTVNGRYGSTNMDLSRFVAGNYTIILMDAAGKKLASEIVVKY